MSSMIINRKRTAPIKELGKSQVPQISVDWWLVAIVLTLLMKSLF